MHRQWFKHKQINNDDGIYVGIHDIIDKDFGDNYCVKRFIDDYIFTAHKRRDVIPLDDHSDEGFNIDDWYIFRTYVLTFSPKL